MDQISIRYGEHVTIPIDTGDITDVSASIYVGKPGETYVMTKSVALTNGVGILILDSDDTKLPLDTYYYQINTVDADGYISKFPSPTEICDDILSNETDFPEFVVGEALDLIEVS